MDNNIIQTVFDSLEADTTALDKVRTKCAALEAKIKEGRYSAQTLQKEIYPERDALQKQIAEGAAMAIDKAKGFVNQYRKDAERLDDLDPSAITDDIKLLQAGIPLLPRDINAILERNQDNRTMIQLTLRYAKEHGIDVKAYYRSGDNERQTADYLDAILSRYEKWIGKENAHNVLRRFFTEG